MNNEKDKFVEFLKRNRPNPPAPSELEREKIWATIQGAQPVWGMRLFAVRFAPVAAVLALIFVFSHEASRLHHQADSQLAISEALGLDFLDEEGLDEIYMYSAALDEEPNH